METAKCPNCRQFPHSFFFVVSGMRRFCNFAQMVLKICTNITATVPLEIKIEVTSCLNCICVAKHQQKRSMFLYFFLSFRQQSKQTKKKDKSARYFSAKIQN
jgi:hypothetical protein